MDVKEAVVARRTIRAFQSRAVPRRMLQEIMERALWTPSWGNTQPWGFTIVGGKTLQHIKLECLQFSKQGVAPHPDLAMPTQWIEIQTSRYKKLGKSLFQALGIGREDLEKREVYHENMTNCFGAPQVIYLHCEKEFNPYVLLDLGLILQTIALLAVNEGLGTCFLARSAVYPDVVRKHAKISSNHILILGTAIGYPIADHPANQFERYRGEPNEFIKWLDVE